MNTGIDDDKEQLIEIGRQWLEHAPEGKPGAPGLAGFHGAVGFVCSKCAGRIIARGCHLARLASAPVWDDRPDVPLYVKCALCGA